MSKKFKQKPIWEHNTLDFDKLKEKNYINQRFTETKNIFVKPFEIKYNQSKVRHVKLQHMNGILDSRKQSQQIQEQIVKKQQIDYIVISDSEEQIESQTRHQNIPNYMKFYQQEQSPSLSLSSALPKDLVDKFMSDSIEIEHEDVENLSFDSITNPGIVQKQQFPYKLYQDLKNQYHEISKDQFLEILSYLNHNQQYLDMIITSRQWYLIDQFLN
ncbi:hypothetical protein pb186bvf_001916 [Paramecium bursaria]